MAFTIHIRKNTINNITIRNGVKEKKEDLITEKNIPINVCAEIRGKMYGRRTINR